ncbi:MAG: MBL fold metallo-hydrolase [Betaproteobacteria bacterium]|nr:MBL fold metallo-hydrolase [Betaproteobacteria bacterium]
MVAQLLPPQVHVFVRDWLSANNVLLKSRDGNVLVDSGYGRHAPLTLALLASPRGLGNGTLSWLVNTHCHSDHVGGNAAVAERYGCPIAIPQGEAAAVLRWDSRALLLDYADQTVERFVFSSVLIPGSNHVWGDLEWQALAAPGHDMGALVFFNPEHGILISGDALWHRGFGLVMPPAVDPEALPATRRTLEMLATLELRVVIPGHGEPFADVGDALDRAFKRLAAFEADPLRAARYALKALLTFTLLDRRRLPLGGMADYVERVGVYRDFNALFFRLPPQRFADTLIAELVAAGAVRREDGWLLPA